MITIAEVLSNLGITEWTLNGEPTNESEFNSMFRKVTGLDDDERVILSENPDDFGVTWTQVKTKYDELVAAEPLNELRRVRNIKLAETDWTQSRDVTLANDADWATYRQALRDITDTYTSLDDVVWPEKP